MSEQGDQITIEVAARLLMLSGERVRQLVKAGYIPLPTRGRTTIVGAVQGYIRFLKDEARKNTKSEAASRAVDARAREIDLKIAERRRELIPLTDALLAMDILVGETNAQLAGLPARITRDLTLRREIEARIDEAKGEIAKALTRGRGVAEKGGDVSDADIEDPS